MFDKTYSSNNEKAELPLELGGIKYTTVEQNVRHLDAFLFVGADGKIEIKHELLSFSLFKFCANHPRFMPLLMEHCQFQMIEEIIRPVSFSNQSEFCVFLRTEMYPDLASRIRGKKLSESLKRHPLLDKNSHFRYFFYSKLKKSESLMRKDLAYT